MLTTLFTFVNSFSTVFHMDLYVSLLYSLAATQWAVLLKLINYLLEAHVGFESLR